MTLAALAIVRQYSFGVGDTVSLPLDALTPPTDPNAVAAFLTGLGNTWTPGSKLIIDIRSLLSWNQAVGEVIAIKLPNGTLQPVRQSPTVTAKLTHAQYVPYYGAL